jgi:hypothetical protein
MFVSRDTGREPERAAAGAQGGIQSHGRAPLAGADAPGIGAADVETGPARGARHGGVEAAAPWIRGVAEGDHQDHAHDDRPQRGDKRGKAPPLAAAALGGVGVQALPVTL